MGSNPSQERYVNFATDLWVLTGRRSSAIDFEFIRPLFHNIRIQGFREAIIRWVNLAANIPIEEMPVRICWFELLPVLLEVAGYCPAPLLSLKNFRYSHFLKVWKPDRFSDAVDYIVSLLQDVADENIQRLMLVSNFQNKILYKHDIDVDVKGYQFRVRRK